MKYCCKSFSRLLILTLCCPATGYAEDVMQLDEVVVTGSRLSQELRNVSATMQIFDREKIDDSPSNSVTEFLSENSVGFFSEWSPGQTSITMRGVRSDGQGRDF